jgi:cell division protein FtsZ
MQPATQPMSAGATALAMPQPMAAPAPAAQPMMADLPAPGVLPAAMQAPLVEPVAEPATAVAAAPAVEPQAMMMAPAEAVAPARPFAAEVAAAGHFVAAPAQPLPSRMPVAEAPRRPDPFAEADMVNQPRKKLGLFERITGARGREAEAPQQTRQVEPQFASRPVPPAPAQASVQAPVQTPAATVAAAPEAPRQADLGLMATAAAPTPSRPQDDLLDIPAFLRRQAN